MSFQELKDLYGLKNQGFHTYLQLRHYIGQEIKRTDLDISFPGLIKTVIEAYIR